jgi:sulfur carrier protein
MKLTVNGQETSFAEELTVSQLLVQQNVRMPEMVSVELNGQILRRSEFDTAHVTDGDTVEFIHFMGGGGVTH